MEVIRTKTELQAFIQDWRATNQDGQISLVPTMGYLHAGHVALMQHARLDTGLVIVSIFVNPLQFNDPVDYAEYPTDLHHDRKICEDAGVDIIFFPDRDEMYPGGEPLLKMSMPELTANLCGSARPGHFEGVLMVVSRLLAIVKPDVAYFGKKDYQQYLVIKRMVFDLDFGIEIRGIETIREADGRAMSSRNARLSASGVQQATLIYRAMQLAEKSFHDSGTNQSGELKEIIRDIIQSGSLNEIDYVEIVDPETLKELETIYEDRSFLVAVAVFCENVRLIDNLLCNIQESE